MRRIYMDANATTPLLPEVFEAMRPFFIERFGNASSIHQQGQHARAAVEHARESVAALLDCRASEIVFTSGGTESDNLALFGILDLTAKPEQHLITTSIEHHAVLHAAEALRDRGIEVTFLACDAQGLIEPETLRAALRPNTKLVSILFANNETGVIQPIAELAAITHAHSEAALFHTDAVQAAGKLPLDLSKAGALKDVDLLSISGHKMYAPQGTGVLFCRRSVRLSPIFFGGSHERQRRPGTENVAGIVALGKAAELAQSWLATPNPCPPSTLHPCHPSTLHSCHPSTQSENLLLPSGAPSFASLAKGGVSGDSPTALTALRDRLEQGLLSAIEECGVNGAGAPRVANTTNIYFDRVEAEALVIALDLKSLSVSAGSACQSGATEPSHVLSAMGLSRARARASVRMSLSRLTTAEEIDRVLEIVPAAIDRLRSLSPTGQKQVATSAQPRQGLYAASSFTSAS